jgi:mRNA-degrading endonuclease RelE of RelBE toxin-antitoxin system
VGKFRVFYDLNEDDKVVVVRAVRKKAPHATTEDIL